MHCHRKGRREKREGDEGEKGKKEMKKNNLLVSWCFVPSQPQRITSGLNTNFTLSPIYSFHKSSEPFRKTFRKRYIVERTIKAEIRLGEQSEKAESCWEDLWNEMQVKGP